VTTPQLTDARLTELLNHHTACAALVERNPESDWRDDLLQYHRDRAAALTELLEARKRLAADAELRRAAESLLAGLYVLPGGSHGGAVITVGPKDMRALRDALHPPHPDSGAFELVKAPAPPADALTGQTGAQAPPFSADDSLPRAAAADNTESPGADEAPRKLRDNIPDGPPKFDLNEDWGWPTNGVTPPAPPKPAAESTGSTESFADRGLRRDWDEDEPAAEAPAPVGVEDWTRFAYEVCTILGDTGRFTFDGIKQAASKLRADNAKLQAELAAARADVAKYNSDADRLWGSLTPYLDATTNGKTWAEIIMILAEREKALRAELAQLRAAQAGGATSMLDGFVDWIGKLDSVAELPGIDGTHKPLAFMHGAAQMRNKIHVAGMRLLRARRPPAAAVEAGRGAAAEGAKEKP